MEWLSKNPKLNNKRFLTAQTVWSGPWEDELDEEGELKDDKNDLFWTDAGGEIRYLNFSNQAARSAPRSKETMMTTGWGKATKDQEEIRIFCYGRSIMPLKKLLSEAKMQFFHDTHQKTTIYRPRQKENRREHWSMWQQVARRPVRPMDTVVLADQEKQEVLADINEYLHPATPRWYASRGIPLRRGYLFYGPPGTGKTSFSFALAGVFGIDIYVISLQDATITEEDLSVLFTKLPRRCIVLLEDIDTAGLRRANDEDEKETVVSKPVDGKEKGSATKDEAVVVNGDAEKTAHDLDKKKGKKSKPKKSGTDTSDSESDSDEKSKRKKKSKKTTRRKDARLIAHEAISLSGLLNAIDGVASHEGRVLILTTNKPEDLDEALVRPGRVDRQVAFTNASSAQAEELFQRMYESRRSRQQLVKGAQKAKSTVEKGIGPYLVDADDGGPLTPEELKRIASEFGQLVPEQVFSPAEIQGFLLKRKKDPRKALEEAVSWIEVTLKQKEAKSKVVTVQ
ncbi:putative mitochondrial chaperone [Emericellopsis cladophorae]|uniref:Mitochondrial chaperone n=1 Tax=Emericellopsis cladophorae TaxID=2686198 RepID=A0A9P9Y7K9_9HYPO|nr:putative mitochondrial chaperone [Emericellopsis cladophorae]KAI6784921.1 putative mitochondrial chaperone [Emericellopsis cladophorae]